MSFLLSFSNFCVPIVICLVIIYGLYKKVDIFSSFTQGAKAGFSIVYQIAPTLIGLFLAIDLARASGLISGISRFFYPLANQLNISQEIFSLSFVKMFSSSAATGMLLDIFSTYGPDSQTGIIASLILCSTETIFYTVSIYCSSIMVKKTRWIIPGALLSSIAGIIASIILGISIS